MRGGGDFFQLKKGTKIIFRKSKGAKTFSSTEKKGANFPKRRPRFRYPVRLWERLFECLGTGQNFSGTRAGTIDRGAKTFFRKKRGRRLFFGKN